MANKKRYFVRLDTKNEPVLGSLITRAKKPKEGNFREVSFANCCTLIASAVASSGNYIIEFKVDGSTYIKILTGVATATGAATYLNTNFPGIASFSGVDATKTIIASDVTIGGVVEMVVTRL